MDAVEADPVDVAMPTARSGVRGKLLHGIEFPHQERAVVAGSGVVPSGGDAAAAATAGRIGLVDIQSSFITAGVRDARSYAVNGTALPALALARAWRAKAPADAGTSDRSCV